jgi:hypothetical protein
LQHQVTGRLFETTQMHLLTCKRSTQIVLFHLGVQSGLRNMRWEAMPAGSERRQQNSSCFDQRRRRLLWRMEWRFEAADYTVVDE